MIPELGQFAIALALALALVQGSVPLLGAHRGDRRLMALAKPLAQAQFVLLLLAFSALAWSFLTHDFSVRNVAQNSFTQLPAVYRFTATWGSHEGIAAPLDSDSGRLVGRGGGLLATVAR
jgi:cytochrome c-type biogenesis protein CcmF